MTQENQAHTKLLASTHNPPPAHQEPCPECGMK